MFDFADAIRYRSTEKSEQTGGANSIIFYSDIALNPKRFRYNAMRLTKKGN